MVVNLRTEKNLGLIGSIFILVGGFVGVIPAVGVFRGTLSLIGEILVLIALKGIGDKLGDDRPFRYYLYSIVVFVGGLVLALILVLIGVFSLSGSTMAFGHVHSPMGIFGATMLAVGFLGIVAVLVLGIYFTIKAWRATYEITGVDEFDKVATWAKWGAITLIILVGAILLLVAMVYQIIAFANLPEELEPHWKPKQFSPIS
ncbi:DUF996 domain-containing protein [Thermococcus sp. M36]|uniref:DUF996 domain-containing protein n=1 Tax=Thermococcus sp. M36 TaxID=1638261 RepID=UPI001438F8F7|nr:DUF996 domain-containing protein [Thermococcus sp. M36]NJE06221.1 DUF996 domain-containing protein [Thermococcus sp. M36]